MLTFPTHVYIVPYVYYNIYTLQMSTLRININIHELLMKAALVSPCMQLLSLLLFPRL